MPVGPDSTRSPRISTALGHYWRQLEVTATEFGETPDVLHPSFLPLRTQSPPRASPVGLIVESSLASQPRGREMTESTGQSRIGVTGLAVMGANLARNIASRGVPVAVHNRTTARTKEFMDAYSGEGAFTAAESTEDFVAALEKPFVAAHPDSTDALFNLGTAYGHLAHKGAKNDKERAYLINMRIDEIRGTMYRSMSARL